MMDAEKAINWLQRGLFNPLQSFDLNELTLIKEAYDTVVMSLRSQPEVVKNEKLSLDEMRKMDGQPVWVNEFQNEWRCFIINLNYPTPNSRIWTTECGVDMLGRATSLDLLAECGAYRRPQEEESK